MTAGMIRSTILLLAAVALSASCTPGSRGGTVMDTTASPGATAIAGGSSATVKRALARSRTIFEDDAPKPHVLLLGVFHFAGEQVDANTTPPDLRIDMLSAERQRQVEHLVQRLAEFKPTRIAIEARPQTQPFIDSMYAAYRAGGAPVDDREHPVVKRMMPADERIQLGFRLAKQLNLSELEAIDAQAFNFRLSPNDSIVTYEKYAEQSDSAVHYWDKRYDDLKAFKDTLAVRSPLNEYLAYLNSPDVQARAIGRWLVTTKRGSREEPIGADGFITRYFNRNVRIFSNIQRIVTRPDDRVLVIYGATHMYMLRQLLAASPEFLLDDIQPYLR